jgi:putative transposase
MRRRRLDIVTAMARALVEQWRGQDNAAIKLIQRVRETGGTRPARIGGYRKPLLDGHEALLRELSSTKRSITLAEIQDALRQRGLEVGWLSTIWAMLRQLDLSHK